VNRQSPFSGSNGPSHHQHCLPVHVFALLILLLSSAGAKAQTAAPTWSQQSPVNSPSSRNGHAMAYDSAHGQVVLFGGDAVGIGVANDTWLWNGSDWTKANPAVSPSPRSAGAMAYDSAHGQVVFFGGLPGDASSTRLSETWLWDGTTWTQANPAISPPARDGQAMVYDPVHGQIVLFGGIGVSSNVLSDTWLWNGTTWTQVSGTGPSARYSANMVYDAATSNVLLFGGQYSEALGDTWSWDGSNWTQLAPSVSPTAREASGIVYDAALGEVVLFGGNVNGADVNDTWLWNGTTWTQYLPTVSPSARELTENLVYDTARSQVLLFGGANFGAGTNTLGDTWEFGIGGNFGNVNVCQAGATTPAPCSKTISFPVTVPGSQNFGTPQVVTQGSTGLDFTLNSGSTCTGPSVTGSCTVTATFTPSGPGLRTGMVQVLYPGNISAAVSIPLWGVGQGPATVIGPGTQSTVNTTATYPLSKPFGVAVDTAGDVFVSDTVAQRVLKVAANGAVTTVGMGLNYPQGMAVDGAGNVYIADNNLNQVVEVPVGCTNASCQRTVGVGLAAQLGVAVDGPGNVFISDFTAGMVVEVPVGCTTAACQIVVYNPAGAEPIGMAVDSAGDLFVADFGLAQVVKIPSGCMTSACQTAVGGGWNQPVAVAVDAAGDVFVAEEANRDVVKVPAFCAVATCRTVIASNVSTVAVAVDSVGNVYYPDYNAGVLNKINRGQPQSYGFPATNVGSASAPLSFTFQNIGNQALNAEGPGLLTINGSDFMSVPGGLPQIPDCSGRGALAPGQACNLSVSFEPQSANSQLLGSAVFTDNASNSTAATQTIFFNGSGVATASYALNVNFPGTGTGLVVDNLSQINCSEASVGPVGTCAGTYVAGTQVTLTATPKDASKFQGWGGACASAGINPTCTLTIGAAASVSAIFDNQSIGSFGVCTFGGLSAPCSTGFPVTFVLPTTTTIGAISVVTQGATGLDFKLFSANTCVGVVQGGTPCTIQATFAPLAAGLRMGAVEMFDSSGNLVATQPVYGIGLEPEVAFGPGVQSALPLTGLHYNVGVAVDAAGNTYVADYVAGEVVKYLPGGGQTTVPLGGLATKPIGVAVDGAGNVYVADLSLPYVLKVTPAGVATQLGSGLSNPIGIAVDGAGNVYVSDQNNNRVVEITPGGVQSTVPFTGLNGPSGLGVDSQGNVFVADGGNSRVLKVTPDGAQTVVAATGLAQPYGVALDAAGDLYIADPVNKRVVEVPASGSTQITLGTGLNYPSGVTVDGAGNLLVGDQGAGQVFRIARSLPPAISFATTNVGSTSVDSPVSFTVQNIGNQPLTGSLALNLGGSFTQNNRQDCSALFPLGPGGTCAESFSFTPQSATFFSGTALFTNNNLNSYPSATQTVLLYGVGATNGVPATVAVPNVVGQTQSAAVTPLSGVGLTMGSVSTASSQTVPSGAIISESPAAGTQVAVGSGVNLLVSTGLPQTPLADPLTLENNYFVTGDYVSAGVTLRGTGKNGTAAGTITIPTYAQSATGGVPDGADIIDAFLYWETLENTATASSTHGTFNGYQLVGQQIGNDIPNYKDGVFTGTIRSYRASVNVYLPAAANGIRYAAGSYAISLPDGGGSAYPLTEGASLVMIYRVLSPNVPLKAVVLYDGAALSTGAATQVVKGFYDAVGGASGTGKSTNLFAASGASVGTWNNSVSTVTLGQANQFNAPMNVPGAYAAVILSTLVNNSDNDGILDAWKAGPTAAGDFHVGQPGYYDAKTSTWVGLPGAKRGEKDLFVQMDYMCGAVLSTGACDPAQENLFPSPDANGNDPLAMVQQAFANSGVVLHLQVGNAISEDTCTDSPGQLCQFPGQPGVIGWKNSLEFSKLYPRNLLSCITGGDCTTRFPYGQKDSYHYVLFGHSLAIPAYNTRFGTLTSINVVNGVTTIVTADRGNGISACPARITLEGVLGNPSLNGVYNTTGCADTKTITVATPGVANWTYPNNVLPEPVIGLTSGRITSISGYSDLGGADSAVTLGLWLTAPKQDMSKRANVLAGTLFHEIGHTLGLSHGGLYYDTAGSYVPTFEANCKPNYQSSMNYLFQLDGVGPSQSVAFSNQSLLTLNEMTAGSVTQLTDTLRNAATFPTSAWYVPYTTGSTASPASLHCDGTPLNGESGYRVDASIAPVTPAWSNGQDLNFIGPLQTQERGYNDLANMDLRQVGATGGEFASLATLLSFGSSVAPLNISSGGNVTLGSGGTIALGSGGNVTLGSGGNVTLGSGGTIALGSGGNVTLGSGGNVTLGSGGTIALGSGGTVTLGGGGNVTLGSGGVVTLGSGGTIVLGSGGNVTLGSGGTIALGGGEGTITVPSGGGSYSIDGNGGTITLGSGGNVTLGSGGNVTLGSGGTITMGSGGNVTLGSGGNVTLGSGGTITMGSGGTIVLGSGGNVTLGSGGTITLGSGGTIVLGSGGNVTLGSGGTVTLGSGGNSSAGNVTLGSGGEATLGAGGTITLGSGGNVTLGSGGNVTLGSGGTITLGSGGNVTLGSGGNVTLGSGGAIALGSGGSLSVSVGGTVTLGSGGTIVLGSGKAPISIGAGGTYTFTDSGGTVTLSSGGNVTLGSGGNVTLGSGGTITLGSGGTVTLGSGGNVTLGSGGNITMGSGGTVTLGSGGTVTLGSGGVVTLGSGGKVLLGVGSSVSLGSVPSVASGSGGPLANELTYETANSVVRPPTAPTETSTPAGVRITWKAPAFGVVQTYTIYRSSNGTTPIVIGSVSGVNGNPPATEFTDTNPDVVSKTVVYTVTTTLVPEIAGGTPRTSRPSGPALLKNDQTIVLGSLPGSVVVTSPPTVTATAMSGGVPNGLQVLFSASGSCAIGSQSVAGGVSSAVVALSSTGMCVITAAQPGTTSFNAANSVSGTFLVLPQGSLLKPQTINFTSTLPSVQYGNTFTFGATSSAGLPVTYTASGPCAANGSTSGVGLCSITASSAGNGSYSGASVTQAFNIYPAVLKVTANNLSITYGQAIPALTYSYSGFMKSDAANVVIGAPLLSTTATAASGPGSYPITVSTGTLATTNYSFLYVSGTLTVQPANQAALVVHATSPLIFGQSETLTTTGGSTNGAVTFNATGAGCSVAGARLTATSGTGTCQVAAVMAGNANYNMVTSSVLNVSLAQAAQVITFTTSPPATAASSSTFTVVATGGASGNPVTFTSAGACSNAGAIYRMNSGVGTCSVIANQAGNSNYAAAPTVLKTVNATGPMLSVSASSLNFGTVYQGSISTKTVTLKNVGMTAVTINDPLLSIVRGGDSKEFIALSLCPKQLPVGRSCTVDIAFVAGPVYTPQTATLEIMSNAPGSPQPVALSATVIRPLATFGPASLGFGTVKHGATRVLNLTLRNTGATPLSLTSVSVTGKNAAYFAQTNNCGSSLAAGGSCSFTVKFTPVAMGNFSAGLTFVDNAQAGGGTQTVSLSGTGN
jgi:sugar lactone lactonase YvrE